MRTWRSNAWRRSRPRNSPANGWWPATTRNWPSSGGRSGRTCSPPRRAALGALARSVARSADRPETAAEIGVRAGKIINHYKMAKHFHLTIRKRHLGWSRKQEAIAQEELLDGIYVIRTSEPTEHLTAADGVRS